MRKSFELAVLMVLAAGCETATEVQKLSPNPSPSEFLLPKRDLSFRLSSAQLQLFPEAMIDRDALQELLSWVRPEHRAPTVAFLQEAAKQGNSVPVLTLDASRPELNQIVGRIFKRPEQGSVEGKIRPHTEP